MPKVVLDSLGLSCGMLVLTLLVCDRYTVVL